MNEDNKRGQNAAISGLALHAALAALLCAIWLITGSPAAQCVFALTAVGMVVWVITAALFFSRRLAELEADEITAAAGENALFADSAEIRLAERRLNLIVKWFCPLVTLAAGGGLGVMAYWLGKPLLGGLPEPAPIGDRSLMWAFFCLGGAFGGFLYSRYAVGMSADPRWRLLRAGGGFLTIGTIGAALLCAAFFLEHLKISIGLQVLPAVVAALMAVLGVELLANLVLDFYRPRTPGDPRRPSFDSRLAGLISDPGGVAQSIAEALNYQFGFEVSGTWFYQLLRQTLVPLLLFGLLALVAISSIVIVGPGHQGVVLTWGRAADDNGTLAPGLHLKAPWPIQSAEVVDTERIRTLLVGAEGAHGEHGHGTPGHGGDDGHGHTQSRRARLIKDERLRKANEKLKVHAPLLLWKVEHGHGEYDFLVPRQATSSTSGGVVVEGDATDDEKYAAFDLVRIVAAVRYRVSNVHQYLYGVNDPDELLSDLATREVTRYAARHDIDTLMNRDLSMNAETLTDAIVHAAKDIGLGVEIISVSIQGVHPPPGSAGAYEEVIKANLEKATTILRAKVDRDSYLTSVAGTPSLARALAKAHLAIRRLRDQGAPAEELAAAEKAADLLLARAGGKARAIINRGRAERWANENAERGRWASFEHQLAAYKAAPKLFILNEKLNMLAESLRDVRKYVLGIDKSKLEIRYEDDRRVVGGGFSMDE